MGYVGGMQAKDKSGRYRKTICNAKHWSSYDVERGIDASPGPRSFDPANGWPEGGEQYNRGSFNAFVSEQDLAETYWPQFRAAVRGALWPKAPWTPEPQRRSRSWGRSRS